MHKIEIWVWKDLHNFVLYIVDEAATIHAHFTLPVFLLPQHRKKKCQGNKFYIIGLSENWTVTQEKTRADISHNQIHNRIKFNFYGSISPCLSFRSIEGEALSVCLPDFNL